MPRFLTLLTAATLAAFSWPALAQPVSQACGAHAEITGKLATAYQEQRAAYAILADGRLIELYTTAGGETWSLVVTWVSGMSCLILAGESWQTVAASSDWIRQIRIAPSISLSPGEDEI